MAANGVSHQVVADDLEGVRAVLQWLSFVPPVLGGPAPALPSRDPSDRPVTVCPAQGGRSTL
jgi:acetyl-CoA carboxylase / biotin carboxylase 1